MSSQHGNSIFERTLRGVMPKLYEVVGHRRGGAELSLQLDLDDSDIGKLKCWIDSCLSLQGGEVAARTRAAVLGRSYLQLSPLGRRRFLLMLAEHYAVDDNLVQQRIEHWRTAHSGQRTEAGNALRDALEAPCMKLLAQFTELADGMKFLVDMRAELLRLRREERRLANLEADLKRLLIGWFDIGLLQLKPIDWRSSAELLEKLIDYEAVHAVQSWGDLKNRLAEDRRCFALFHPKMPDEPLIFVTVALVRGLATDVGALLDEQAARQEVAEADTAIFYSISNAQRGLAGISFGNYLIKKVVTALRQDLPGLRQFATLSPIPGFCRWLQGQPREVLDQLPGGSDWNRLSESGLVDDWYLQAELVEQLQQPLIRLAAWYLGQEKRNGRALDPVAHFHLSNGARLEQLNWMADRSGKGLRQSAGLMVNYHYELDSIEQRSQQYGEDGTVALSPRVSRLTRI